MATVEESLHQLEDDERHWWQAGERKRERPRAPRQPPPTCHPEAQTEQDEREPQR